MLAACTATVPPEVPAPSAVALSPAVRGSPTASGAGPATEAPSGIASATPAPQPAPTAATAAPPGTPAPIPTAGVPSPPPLAASPYGEDPGMRAALGDVLLRSVAERRIPGLAASVTFADGSTWDAGAGRARIDTGVIASPATRFAVGSVTKTFVAALILQLVDEGKVRLDDRLARYLPRYPRADRITLRQLLAHTSGVYNYFENPAYERQVFSHPAKHWTTDEILGFVKKPYFAPGAGFHYSNTNFVLLGLVAQEVTGRRIAREIRRRFLDPLGLDDTYFQGEERVPEGGSAHGYLLVGDAFRGLWDGSPIEPNTSAATVAWGAGAMSSTVQDLARWAGALYAGAVLSPESLAQLVTFDARNAYGLGTRLATFEGQRAWGHTGSLRGFTSAMWFLPDVRMTVVVATNRGRINANAIVSDLVREAFPRLGLPIVPLPTPTAPPSPAVPPVPSTQASP